MNESKRRGRPTNAERAAQAAAQAFPDAEAAGLDPVKMVEAWAQAHDEANIRMASQAYANKVWAGQSVSLPYGERWYRVKVALEAQGMSMDGVVLK